VTQCPSCQEGTGRISQAITALINLWANLAPSGRLSGLSSYVPRTKLKFYSGWNVWVKVSLREFCHLSSCTLGPGRRAADTGNTRLKWCQCIDVKTGGSPLPSHQKFE
jgi:hypothetical protein